MRSDVAVAILAGGEGTRIGGRKPLLRLSGERLIDHALRQAARWSDAVAVAVRDPAQVAPVDVPIIIDEPDIPGPLAGLVSALRFGADTGRELLLTIPADMPFLPGNLLDRLIAEIGDTAASLASSGGHLHPVCGLWRTSALDQLGRYLGGERRSLKGFAALVGSHTVDWAATLFDPFLNINTADDLAQAERRAAG
jgi:molybdenum cofactor guanylyltransferase